MTVGALELSAAVALGVVAWLTMVGWMVAEGGAGSRGARDALALGRRHRRTDAGGNGRIGIHGTHEPWAIGSDGRPPMRTREQRGHPTLRAPVGARHAASKSCRMARLSASTEGGTEMSHRVLPAETAFWRPSNQLGVKNSDLASGLRRRRSARACGDWCLARRRPATVIDRRRSCTSCSRGRGGCTSVTSC